jgi:hypothetical protein
MSSVLDALSPPHALRDTACLQPPSGNDRRTQQMISQPPRPICASPALRTWPLTLRPSSWFGSICSRDSLGLMQKRARPGHLERCEKGVERCAERACDHLRPGMSRAPSLPWSSSGTAPRPCDTSCLPPCAHRLDRLLCQYDRRSVS